MKTTRVLSVLVAVSIAAVASYAGDTQITSVSYPERQKVDLALTGSSAAPAKAKVKGSVEYEQGQATVEISYSGMQPAVLFGGDIASYVVWAISRNATPENLGELIVEKKNASGSGTYRTGKKDFGIMITAEPYYLVSRPCDVVVFTSAPADTKKVTGSSFIFQDFRPGPKPGVASISTLTYEDKTPVPVKQAESALALIDRLQAGDVNPDAVKTATMALGEAQASARAGGNAKSISDAARRSISSSAEALRSWGQARDAKAASDAAAKQANEKSALEAKAAAAQAESAKTAEALTATEAQAASLTQQRDALARERAAIAKERDALKAKLQGALGQVADTRDTARGTVTSLSGVLFDTGKATLKPEAKITLAKLAGVMLVFGKTTMQVEGYTDNTGSEATNVKLSEDRAKAVREFLESQGITSNRLTSTGKGPADPVAPNDTPEGRSKNRRVEIVSSEPAL
ncbi:MAG TPA: OmpA family protein [Candidatus Polarisedimenticolaceae bacterium]|nr:OmpA family protein [Candidatus Polarisedimenticolaceae bacterium]